MVRRRSEVRPARIDPRVRLIRGAVPLVTVTVSSSESLELRPERFENAIVKLIPERGMSAGARQAFAEACKAAGAHHVWFAPARGGDKALGDQKLAASPQAVETAREAIGWLLEHAISANPEKLVQVVEDALARAGL